MTTATFSDKLDDLAATVQLYRNFDATSLANSLRNGAGRHALAIGSGGSVVAAEYFARCRDTLGLGPTTVQTPMQAVFDHHRLADSDVWLFSAGGENPDAIAAVRAVHNRGAKTPVLVTRNSAASAASLVTRAGGTVHVVPVADSDDGFLATHSLVAAFVALLLGCDVAVGKARGADSSLDIIVAALIEARDPARRISWRASLVGLGPQDTVIVAADPLLRPVATFLDSSMWEAALCSIQSTDFRNLAHGRHSWLHHRTKETFVIALTGHESHATWLSIETHLPDAIRRATLDCRSCGRLDNALALIECFSVVEAIGSVLGVDPGKPGIGSYGRAVYNDGSLSTLSEHLEPRVREKRAAIARTDERNDCLDELHVIGSKRLEMLSCAKIGGAVFDYDGTIVSTDRRFSPPSPEIVDELVRLHRSGLKLGVATGRGGSAGEELRKVLPADVVSSVFIGYYNGGYVQRADVDISSTPPPLNPAVAEASAWLRQRSDILLSNGFKECGVQMTIRVDQLRQPEHFIKDFGSCPPVNDGRLQIMASGHSYDVIPAASSKLTVIAALKGHLTEDQAVLCFGDSGSRFGNDHALLSHPFGVSVGEVCDAPNGCWSLFGGTHVGPDALLIALRAMQLSGDGTFYLDVSMLTSDSYE